MYRIAAAIVVLGLTACEAVKIAPPPGSSQASTQNWLCGREYTNMAWGYQRHGVVLDTDGNVWRYDIRSAPNNFVNPWSPKDTTAMSEAELKLRYNGAMVTGNKVSRDEIAHYLPLIAEAATGKPTEPQHVGADMGQHLSYCFTYNETTHSYAQVMLDNRGDMSSTNSSPAARQLDAWLDKVIGTDN